MISPKIGYNDALFPIVFTDFKTARILIMKIVIVIDVNSRLIVSTTDLVETSVKLIAHTVVNGIKRSNHTLNEKENTNNDFSFSDWILCLVLLITRVRTSTKTIKNDRNPRFTNGDLSIKWAAWNLKESGNNYLDLYRLSFKKDE